VKPALGSCLPTLAARSKDTARMGTRVRTICDMFYFPRSEHTDRGHPNWAGRSGAMRLGWREAGLLHQCPHKKRPPFSAGAKLPWFSRVARAFLAAVRPGGAVGAVKSLRGWLRGFGAAHPHLSWNPRHGETRNPGPPNCFPSAGCVRCWCEPGPAWYRRLLLRPGNCPTRRSACGRRESDAR